MPMLNISEPNKLQQRIHIRHFPGMKRQNEACTQCIKQIQKARPHAWIAFIDIDELIKDDAPWQLLKERVPGYANKYINT